MNIKKYSSFKSSGYEIVTTNDSDKLEYEGETHQCCHCGKHWQIKPGSGITRGFCIKCNSFPNLISE